MPRGIRTRRKPGRWKGRRPFSSATAISVRAILRQGSARRLRWRQVARVTDRAGDFCGRLPCQAGSWYRLVRKIAERAFEKGASHTNEDIKSAWDTYGCRSMRSLASGSESRTGPKLNRRKG